MGEALLYCVNTVFPIFLMVGLGQLFLRIRLLDEGFFTVAEKFVFRVALPCNLFLSVYGADAKTAFDPQLILFCIICITVTFLLPTLIIPLFLKDNGKRGAFAQGVFRSNFAILGVPLADRLFPETGTVTAASLMPFTIPLFNVFAVIALTVYSTDGERCSFGGTVKKSLLGIVKNPLIIGIALGIPFMLIKQLVLPDALYTGVNYLSALSTPLALLCLGGSIRTERLKSNVRLAAVAAALKIAAIPLVTVALAALFGFRGVSLGVILTLFGAPTAVSSFIMAKNMKSDHELAGQILLLTTLFCLPTLFAGIYALRALSLI